MQTVVARGTTLCFNLGMELRTIIEKLQADDLSRVSDATGLPYETLRRIARGKTPGPRITTVERIAAYYTRPKRERAVA